MARNYERDFKANQDEVEVRVRRPRVHDLLALTYPVSVHVQTTHITIT